MTTMTVWHANLPVFGRGDPEFSAENYTLVALVDGESVDDAFFLTNHVNRPWWENDGVTLVGEPKVRSTSVGDVVVRDGESYRCARFGWEKVELPGNPGSRA